MNIKCCNICQVPYNDAYGVGHDCEAYRRLIKPPADTDPPETYYHALNLPIPVEKLLPKYGETVLVFCLINRNWYTGWLTAARIWRSYNFQAADRDIPEVSHWKRLPAPPEAIKKEPDYIVPGEEYLCPRN